jgi:CDP-diacylglycerol---glycerol-3-phosphate 3-phosphatidyltransferase
LLSSRVGHSLDPLALRIYRLFFRSKNVRPNVLTLVGLLFAVAASACVATSQLLVAGVLLLLAGVFDILDGVVARNTGAVTPFGGFFDSVLDRYSDLLVAFGVLLFFLQAGDVRFVVFTGLASIGVAIIPYARARAEAAGIPCKNGLMERPERIVLLVLGLCLNMLRPAIVILAVLTHVTVIQRMFLVRKEMKAAKAVGLTRPVE